MKSSQTCFICHKWRENCIIHTTSRFDFGKLRKITEIKKVTCLVNTRTTLHYNAFTILGQDTLSKPYN